MKKKCFFLIGLIGWAFISCAPETDYLEPVDYNRVGYLTGDNFNLSIFNAAIQRAGLDQVLLEDGPFTLLVPSDDALVSYGYANANAILAAPAATVSQLVNYHLIDGHFEFDKLPFLFNQEIRSRGGRLYVTRWISGADTVITINGKQILPPNNIMTNNGVVHILNEVLHPVVYGSLWDAIRDNESLTLFAEAVRTAGLEDVLSDSQSAYTVFAPSNGAMTTVGYASVEAVNAAPPEELVQLVQDHIMLERRFRNDYILTIPYPDISAQIVWSNGYTYSGFESEGPYAVTVSGHQVGVYLVIRNNFPEVVLQLRDITGGIVNITSYDNMATNGILHVVNGILRNRF